MSSNSSQQYTYEIIELVISTISLLCCFFMIYIYGKQPSLRMFSYATQFYILMGAMLFTMLDFVFNSYYLDALNTECQSTSQVGFETSMCQITSYISTYGIMNMICWQTVLISITRQAVLQKKTEQFSGHIYLITYAFFCPLLFTIIPQLSNESIYGPYDNVCWLQYNYTHNYTSPINCNDSSTDSTNRLLHGSEDTYFYANSYDIILFSLLFYFLPIIIQCTWQLLHLSNIEKEINKLKKEQGRLPEAHIKAIRSLKILPWFFLVVVCVPFVLFILEFSKILVEQWVFQIFKGMLSATALVLFFAFSRNEYLCLMAKVTLTEKPDPDKEKYNRYKDKLIDLFQGIEK